MTAAAVLAIVVAVGDGQTPTTTSMLATAAKTVGPATSIRLIESKEPTDAFALRVEREQRAGLVVTVIWKEPAHLHAQVRLHVARSDRWTTRAIDFSVRDTLEERGRTLGLAVASAWPETVPVTAETRTAEKAPGPGKSPTPAPAPASASASASAPTSPPPATVAVDESPTATPPPPAKADDEAANTILREGARARDPTSEPRPPLGRMGLGIVALGAVGIGGPAIGLGGSADGVLFVAERLCVRLGIGLRGGSVPALPGSDLVGTLAAGFEWWFVRAAGGETWDVGIRMDGLLLRHQVRSTGTDGQPETQGRFLPATDAFVQSTVRLTGGVQLLVGAGAELAFGATDIRRGSDRLVVATIPPLRGLAQAGLRVRF